MSASYVPLNEAAEFINGVAFKPGDWGDAGKPIIRIQNLTDPSKPFNRTIRTVPPKFHVQPGDLLVSWSASLGVFQWSLPETALLNQHIFRVIPDSTRVDKRYLRHGLEVALLDMQRHLHGATMQHVNRGEFLSTKILLPTLSEQRRIAEILDRAEALRAKRRSAIAQLGALTQSVFLDMFGDPTSNMQGWERVPFGELLTNIDSGWSPPCLDRPIAGEEWGVLKLGAVTCDTAVRRSKLLFEYLETFGFVDCLDLMVGEPRHLANCPCGEVPCRHTRTQRRRQSPEVPYNTDYMLASRATADRLIACCAHDTEQAWAFSDHCPVVADFDF
jgi:Type I restriction modification DNA specificity domain